MVPPPFAPLERRSAGPAGGGRCRLAGNSSPQSMPSWPNRRQSRPHIVDLPYPANPFFIGRDDELVRIHEELHAAPVAALTQGRVRAPCYRKAAQ